MRWVGILCILGTLGAFVNGYLYNDVTSAHMHMLNGNTVDAALLNSTTENIWLMQFFSHWCGSCQNFVPKWIKIVEAVQHWNPIVKSAALDCAENSKICRKYRVNGYPCVRLYWPAVSGITFHDFGNLLPFNHRDIVNRIGKAIVSLALNNTIRSSLPNVAKYLLPVKLGSDAFWDFRSKSAEKFVIIESEADVATYGSLGSLLCLNTSSLYQAGRLQLKYSVLARSEVTYPQEVLYAKTGYRTRISLKFPLLIQIDGAHRRVVGIVAQGRDSVIAFFDTYAELKTEVLATTMLPPSQRFSPVEGSINDIWLPEDDLYGAVYHFINNEVTLHEEINPSRMNDLLDFLGVIIGYVPWHSQAIDESLRSIYMTLTKKNAPNQIPIARWLDIVREADMPPPRPWNHCKGSKPYFRGYPCSLWLLFHTITANAARQSDSFEITTAFPAIRGFVRSFFGCRECAGHFWNATDKYANTPNSEAHVLVWKIHNRVNARLAGAVSEDPQAPKVQFPSYQLCPQCYTGETEDGQPQWNRKAVAIFLRRYFSPESIIPLSDVEGNWNYQARSIKDYVFKTD